MKDITIHIRVKEEQFQAEKELIKFLIWEALINGRSTYFEEAFTVDSILVANIEEVNIEPPAMA